MSKPAPLRVARPFELPAVLLKYPHRPGQRMDQRSGLAKASGILLLVGAILQAVGAAFALGFTALFATIMGRIEESAVTARQPPFPISLFLWIYGIMGLLLAAGSVLGFVAYGKTRKGDWQGAFVWGLVGCLLPPVSVLGLLGAIFAKVCPEAEGRQPGWQQPWPPQPPQSVYPPPRA